MSSDAAVRGLLDEAVAAGVFPGGVLAVGDGGRTVLELACGRTARVPAPGPEVTLDTFYDVASLTKAVVTSLVTLRLVERGLLGLDDPAELHVPGAPGTVRQLLSHSAGLPAWRPLHERLVGERSPRDRIVELAAAEPPERPPGVASVYSDLGFILLGAVCERAGRARLDALAADLVLGPLGAGARFVDLARPGHDRPSPVAATELDARRGLIQGEVHDENCHAAGGVLGHAGLFATAGQLSTVAAALVAAWHGDARAFPPDLVRAFFAPAGVPGSTWRLGWDGPAPAGTQAGERWPKSGVGHLGFTGTSLWLDPPRRRWVVLLTNRVHPSRDDQRIRAVRPAVHDAVIALLDP
jgi:CubicO group peptidase (beta-lactamase class C family)